MPRRRTDFNLTGVSRRYATSPTTSDKRTSIRSLTASATWPPSPPHRTGPPSPKFELSASGGRAYLSQPGEGFQRRLRESAFIPVVTPSLVQLKLPLRVQELPAAVGATA